MNGKPKTIDFNYSIITFSAFQINIDLFFFLPAIKHHIHLCSVYRNYNIYSLFGMKKKEWKSKNRSALVAIEKKNVKIRTRINTLYLQYELGIIVVRFFLSVVVVHQISIFSASNYYYLAIFVFEHELEQNNVTIHSTRAHIDLDAITTPRWHQT